MWLVFSWPWHCHSFLMTRQSDWEVADNLSYYILCTMQSKLLLFLEGLHWPKHLLFNMIFSLSILLFLMFSYRVSHNKWCNILFLANQFKKARISIQHDIFQLSRTWISRNIHQFHVLDKICHHISIQSKCIKLDITINLIVFEIFQCFSISYWTVLCSVNNWKVYSCFCFVLFCCFKLFPLVSIQFVFCFQKL